MLASDIGSVPMSCFGDLEKTRARIADLGSAAILAFDGDQHVAQLQFRRFRHGVRSPRGVWHPMYWLDFGGHAPPMARYTICICCYHVGQIETGDERDPRYQGRGIGTALLDALLEWTSVYDFALIAKATPPVPAVSNFMGGMPAHVYEACGFEAVDRWFDADLASAVREQALVPEPQLVDASTVACCVRR